MATAQLQSTGITVRNVLIATDLSRQSEDILHAGMDLRSAYGAHATILYVLPRDEYILAGFEAFASARDAARRDLVELEEKLSTKYACPRGNYEVLMADGNVTECIFECVTQRNIDLIVLGTHGRSGFSKAFVGSVAERVFRNAEVPVLTIGPSAHSSLLSVPKRLLAPIDFTTETQHSAKYACALAREHDAELVLLHVIAEVPRGGAMADFACLKHTVEQSLAELISCEEKPKQVRVVVKVGKVVPTVLNAAAELDTDLLVMGVHTYPRLLDHLRLLNAYELVRQAPCPVLTVR